jgi:hypothetical protein
LEKGQAGSTAIGEFYSSLRKEVNMAEVSNEQMQQLIDIMDVQEPLMRQMCILVVDRTLRIYQASLKNEPLRLPVKKHRKQIERLHNSAHELRSAINSLWMRELFFIKAGEAIKSENEKYNPDSDHILAHIEAIIGITRAALHNDELLAELRFEDEPNQGKKSFDRRVLWEPLFQLWVAVKGELKFSEDGPLHRFIDAAQVMLGRDRTNRETLKKAVRSWNSKQGNKGS